MKTEINDQLEIEIATALDIAGINYKLECKDTKYLDFYLPDFDVYIEIKGGDSDRTANQIKRDHNVILCKGVKATAFLASAITLLSRGVR